MTTLLENLPHECSISRYVPSEDGIGGIILTKSVLQTGVKCWEQSGGAMETNTGGRKSMVVHRKVYFKDDPNLDSDNLITITKRDGTAVATDDQVDLDVATVESWYGPGGLQYHMAGCNEPRGERNDAI